MPSLRVRATWHVRQQQNPFSQPCTVLTCRAAAASPQRSTKQALARGCMRICCNGQVGDHPPRTSGGRVAGLTR